LSKTLIVSEQLPRFLAKLGCVDVTIGGSLRNNVAINWMFDKKCEVEPTI